MANYYEPGSTSAPESPITRRKKMMAESQPTSQTSQEDDKTEDTLNPAKKFIKGFTGVK